MPHREKRRWSVSDIDPTLAETQSEFARRIGKKKGYITQLKQAGRLVMTEDGRRVLVQASIDRIAATMDPSKAAVAERHSRARAAKAQSPADPQGDDEEPKAPASTVDPKYQQHRAERERWLALAAERDYRVSMRELLPADEVDRAVQMATGELRARLERLPDVLAPQLAAETDESRCYRLLADEVDQSLHDLAKRFGDISRADA